MNEQKLQELISQLHNGNDKQRRASSYKLSKSKDPAAVPALIQAYNDTDSSVRQNAVSGLRAIGTQEALDFLNSKKADLSKNISIAIDGGLLKTTADGRIIMGSNPTVMTWLGVVFWGVLALGLLVVMIKTFLDGSASDSNILVPLVITGLFGYLTYNAYQQTQRGQTIIDSAAHKIKTRKREINFEDIESLAVNQTSPPFFRGNVIKVTFLALVTTGNPMILGSISGDLATIEKKGAQIMELLSDKGLSFKTNSTI